MVRSTPVGLSVTVSVARVPGGSVSQTGRGIGPDGGQQRISCAFDVKSVAKSAGLDGRACSLPSSLRPANSPTRLETPPYSRRWSGGVHRSGTVASRPLISRGCSVR